MVVFYQSCFKLLLYCFPPPKTQTRMFCTKDCSHVASYHRVFPKYIQYCTWIRFGIYFGKVLRDKTQSIHMVICAENVVDVAVWMFPQNGTTHDQLVAWTATPRQGLWVDNQKEF